MKSIALTICRVLVRVRTLAQEHLSGSHYISFRQSPAMNKRDLVDERGIVQTRTVRTATNRSRIDYASTLSHSVGTFQKLQFA
ncbi:MAG: hypothetical protein QXU32_01775 [Nitrososphaerales archaeon]